MSAIGSNYQEEQIKRWVESNLISNDDDGSYFDIYKDYKTRQSKFGDETLLYSASLGNNLLVSLVDGTAPPAGFKFVELMKSVQAASKNEECYWVHVNEPDNCMAVLESVHQHSWESSQEHPLIDLELNQAAEGGGTHLCLVPESKNWVLAHELNPGVDFTISLHAQSVFSDAVLSSLGVSDIRDVRAQA